MNERLLVLRASLKLLSAVALLWLAYIFLAGLIDWPESPSGQVFQFNLDHIPPGEAKYFKLEQRELLVIEQMGRFRVFWANDPVYGCRLEYKTEYIQPVCIDIRYDLDGYNRKLNQQLKQPEFSITPERQLKVQL